MSLVFTMILIPVLCIAFSLYVMTLYQYATTGALDTLFLVISIFVLVFGTFMLLICITKQNEKNIFLKEIEDRLLSYHAVICIVYLLMFSVALFIKTIIVKNDVLLNMVSIALSIFCIYAIYDSLFKKPKVVVELTSIGELYDDLYELSFSTNEEVYTCYVKSLKGYKENKKYMCTVNTRLSKVYKIVEYVEVEKNEQ